MEEQHIQSLHSALRQFALEQVTFHPTIHDYLILPRINRAGHIDAVREAYAAEIVLYQFRQRLIEAGQEASLDKALILGIENSGVSFAKAVQRQLKGSSLLLVHKYDQTKEEVPFKDPYVTNGRSYSAQADRFFRVPIDELKDLLEDSGSLLIVDDVIAEGHAMNTVNTKLRKNGIYPTAGFAYFSKMWQNGVQDIQSHGIPVYSALEIEEIVGEGKDRRINIAPFKGRTSNQSMNSGQRGLYYWIQQPHP